MPGGSAKGWITWVTAEVPRAISGYHGCAMPAPHLRIEVIDKEMAATLRQMTGAERLAIASKMFSSARRMLINHLRSVHPDWEQPQIEQEAARRLSHGTV